MLKKTNVNTLLLHLIFKGCTPLDKAALNRNNEITAILVNHGADINVVDEEVSI